MLKQEFKDDRTPKQRLYAAMQKAYQEHKDTKTYTNSDGQDVEGAPQGYIKAWADVDPDQFGIAAVSPDGEILEIGDTREKFIMTSAIKPFIALYILAKNDEAEIRKHIDVEAAGQPFNTTQLNSKGLAPNHMVNLGAICGSSWIDGDTSQEKIANFREFFDKFTAGSEPLNLDMDVALGEIPNGTNNHIIAAQLNHAGHLNSTPQEALEVYYALNFIEANAVDFAVMGATINNGGINPVTGVDVFEDMDLTEDEKIDLIGDLQSMMVTAGMYDAAGKWSQEVGMPAKSCVGGGVFAGPTVSPEESFGLGIFGPRLDAEGNSLQAVLAAKSIVNDMNWNPTKRLALEARAAQRQRHAAMNADGPRNGSDLQNGLNQ